MLSGSRSGGVKSLPRRPTKKSSVDGRVEDFILLKTFDGSAGSPVLLSHAPCAQETQYLRCHNGVSLCRKAFWCARADNGPSPWNRVAPCSHSDRFVHLMSAWGLCNRHLGCQRRADQCIGFYVQERRYLGLEPCLSVAWRLQKRACLLRTLVLMIVMA